MNNINQVEKLIETYKIHLKKDRLKDELYKWQLLTKFKGRPRLDILHFAKEITSINFANLIYYSGVTVIKQLAEGKPEAYKTILNYYLTKPFLLHHVSRLLILMLAQFTMWVVKIESSTEYLKGKLKDTFGVAV